MDKYFINFYKDRDGSEVKGDWKDSEEAANDEKDSSLFRVKLGLRFTAMKSIDKSEVEKMAKKHDMSPKEILDCVY